MRCPRAIADEAGRLAALGQYGFVPGAELPSLQPIVDMAARMFGVAAAAVNMIGSDEVFFAASSGIDECDMRRDISFCAHTITQAEMMVVEDAEHDPRFHDNPLVETGMIRFYAGVPLLAPTGHALGALCVVDTKPRPRFDAADRARLRALADLVLDQLELRRIETARRSQPPRYEAPMRDIDERRHLSEDLQRLAAYDNLTGLPDRNQLSQRAAACIAQGRSCAVLIIDLDGFDAVNSRFGQAAGDAALKEIGWRLAARIGSDDMVARVGGDEFAILLAHCGDPLQLSTFAEPILADIAHPMTIHSQTVRLAASCGLALAPTHGTNADELIGNAELALFQAKADGGRRLSLFAPALRSEAMARRIAEAELRRAVERGEFVLHYQPRIAPADGTLVGADALIRWHHPRRGLLQPAEFLPALEAASLAGEVARWTIATSCAQAARWRRIRPDFEISVSLSKAQVQDGSVADAVGSALDANGLPGSALCLDIGALSPLSQAADSAPSASLAALSRERGFALVVEGGAFSAHSDAPVGKPVPAAVFEEKFLRGEAAGQTMSA